MSNIFEPTGVKWTDEKGRKCVLVTNGVNKDWICYQHPDGQWVTLQKVNQKERLSIIDKLHALRKG